MDHDGRLAYNSVTRTWGGAHGGETCDACEEMALRRLIRTKLTGIVQFVVAFLSDSDGQRHPRRTRLSGRSARVISAEAARTARRPLQ
jgi:hypothetical protein